MRRSTETHAEGKHPAQRVLLATPIPRRSGLRHSSHYPHIGLASIASSLLVEGVEVEVFDGTLTPSLQAWRDRIMAFQPDFVGLSAYTCQVKAAHDMAAVAKVVAPGVGVVVGGPHPTALPGETLLEFPGFDYAIQGEGEEALGQLVRSGGELSVARGIPGLAYRDGDALRVNPTGDPLDLDALPPPAWHLFDLASYRSMAFLKGAQLDGTQSFRVETTRGCPHRCAFCSHVLGRKVRKRRVSSVLQEIQALQRRFGARSITFAADTFTIDRRYTLALCEGLARLDPPVQWFCGTRPDCLDPELMTAMRAAGCDSIGLGIESGSQAVLDAVHKGGQLDHVWSVVRELKRQGFVVTANFILGLPEDRRATMLQTIALAQALEVDYATFTLFTPFPGAPLTRFVEETQGFAVLSRDWDLYDTQSPRYLIAHPALPGWQVELLHKWAYARFYLRPGHFWKLRRVVDVGSIWDYLVQVVRSRRPGFVARGPAGEAL